MRLGLFSLCLLACGPGPELSDDPGETGTVYVGGDFPDPPAGGWQLANQDLEVPPYSERQYCLFGTYDGDDAAVVSQIALQDEAFGHHMTLLATTYTTSEFPDGTLYDCTEEESLSMLRFSPIFVSGRLELPDGMGIELKNGTRWILQTHYINPTGDTVFASDAMNIGFAAPESIDTWVASVAHSTLDIDVPPGGEQTSRVDCAVEQDLELVWLNSHMHQWGSAFSVDFTPIATGVAERIYEIPEWLPEHRADSPSLDLWDDPLHIAAGDRFETTCSWFNDTDEPLGFPQEMCVMVAMAWPLREPITCIDM